MAEAGKSHGKPACPPKELGASKTSYASTIIGDDRRDHLPLGYIGGFEFAPHRQIAPPPSDKNAALILICSVIERHVGRLEELLAEHEQIEAAEAAERYDRAALDCSPAFERHRRYQSARHRELMRTLETLRKMRKEEFG